MKVTVKEFMEKTFNGLDHNVRDRAYCSDGFTVSIQGGTSSHYCTPREVCNVYEELELGFPSELPKELEEYAKTKGTCDSVFGYVPISIVEKVIENHGGIVATLQGIT